MGRTREEKQNEQADHHEKPRSGEYRYQQSAANILTTDLIDEVNAFVLSLTDDPDTRVVVFKSGNEKFFSAHLDLNVINATQEGQAACVKFSRMIKNIKAMQQLSIAFVDGIARGGGNEFVMACDLAYGSPVAGGCGPRACSRTLAGAFALAGESALRQARWKAQDGIVKVDGLAPVIP